MCSALAREYASTKSPSACSSTTLPSARPSCTLPVRWSDGHENDRGHPQLYQEGFVVHPPVPLGGARSIEGTFEMSRRPGNWRQYDVRIAHLVRLEGGRIGAEADSTYHLN